MEKLRKWMLAIHEARIRNMGIIQFSPECAKMLLEDMEDWKKQLEDKQKKIEELEERIAIRTKGSETGETLEENAADPFDFPCDDPTDGV